ncbi:transporter substrate-binding domain-containing protein [Aureimonas pseudogalii]|uniref:Cyclohexadienyl dehydratase n=1 Tax=Aureimonas pseudogalii TaxID=1744844 RepID=A0A7W6H4L7_9HYPH|nr:transporter substrate-binding domain-containing protein [Aureimonas pseudogalii]MBB3998493.1 cyclohexadienyl dehydratase [Aureimonas pseudogalii]
MPTTLRFLLASFVATACLGSTAQAAEATSRLDDVVQRKVLNVCTTGDYRPFSYRADGANDFTGIDIDLARSLAKSLEAEAAFIQTKWSDLLVDFQTKCDIAMGGISKTLPRQRQVSMSALYMVNGKAPIVRCDDVSKYQSVAAINQPGTRVVVNPGGTNEKFAKASFDKAEIRMFPDNRTIFQEILDGRADVMVAESIEVKLQEKLHPGLCAVNPDQPLQYGEMGYLLPRGDVVFKDYVDQWMHLAKATGEFDAILQSNMK